MWMDAFYAHTACDRKRRYHFHEFMADVHRRLHRQKLQYDAAKANAAERAATMGKRDETPAEASPSPPHVHPVTAVALDMADEFSLLCLDELQVVDVADAVVLSQLLEALLAAGTVLVATSNRPAADLYADGMHRDTHVLPFIAALQRHCIVHDMESGTDYRQLLQPQTDDDSGDSLKSMFFVLARDDGTEMLDPAERAFRARADSIFGPLAERRAVELIVGAQRTIRVTAATVGDDMKLAYCHFDELCGGRGFSHCSFGATDYRAMARHFDAVAIENIPILSDSSFERWTGHNQARRFITLIDELYEAKTPVLCSGRAPLPRLFVSTTKANLENEENDDIGLGVDLAVDSNGLAVSALASVTELQFAFQRAASRLVELTSAKWWDPIVARRPAK